MKRFKYTNIEGDAEFDVYFEFYSTQEKECNSINHLDGDVNLKINNTWVSVSDLSEQDQEQLMSEVFNWLDEKSEV